MNTTDFPRIHKFISKKFNTHTVVGPSRRMEYFEKQPFIDALNIVTPISDALSRAGLKPSNLTDSTILSLAPLVVRGDYTDPKKFYDLVLGGNIHEFPKNCSTVLSEIINLACATTALPENRVKYLFIRKIAKEIFERFPEISTTYRVLIVNTKCQIYLIADRFMFFTYGDTGIARNPKGHIDLFGFDLHGVVHSYLTADELHNVNYKMPTMLSFKNIPSTDKTSGGAVLIKRMGRPTEHTWVEILGREVQLPEEITLDFNSISQNYVTNVKTVLNDQRWAEIKSMLKFKGKYDAKFTGRKITGIKALAQRAQLQQTC